MKTRILTACALMTAITLVLETTAALCGEPMVIITIFSALPIYISTRLNIKGGIISYCTTALLLGFLSPHQMVFFAFTNGLIGISLGICHCKQLRHIATLIIPAILMTAGLWLTAVLLNIMNVLFARWWIFTICLIFCVGYTALCNFLLEKIYRLLQRRINDFGEER